MRSFRHQAGASLITWLIILAVAGVLAIVGIKLTPVYIEALTVKSVLESVASEEGVGQEPKRVVWGKIAKRLSVNNIDYVTFDNFEIELDNNRATFTLDYEVRTPIMGNVDAVLAFRQAVPAR